MEIIVKSIGREWKIEAPETFWNHFLALLADSYKKDDSEGFHNIARAKEDEYFDIVKQIEKDK